MSIEAAKAISIRSLIERETGLRFRKNRLNYCPFCNSGNHGHGNSDSAFTINERSGNNYYKCFSCGESGSTIDFIMKFKGLDLAESITYLEQNYLGNVKFEPIRSHPRITKEVIPDYIPQNIVATSLASGEKNNLKIWLREAYGEDVANKAITEYRVGTSKYKDGATVFFFIDEAQQVRRGKVMLYDPLTGKRKRSVNPTWVHHLLRLDNKPEQCLFGLHLLNEYLTKTIAVVESEKTAIIMSIIVPKYLWMATGGLSSLKPKMFIPLKNRNVILYPDAGKGGTLGTPYEQWEQKLSVLQEYVSDIALSDLLERKATEDQKIAGFDIADYFVSETEKIQ